MLRDPIREYNGNRTRLKKKKKKLPEFLRYETNLLSFSIYNNMGSCRAVRYGFWGD